MPRLLFLLLFSLWPTTGQGGIEFLLPWRPADACHYYFERFMLDPFSHATGYDPTSSRQDQVIDTQWNFIDPEYALIPGITSGDREAMRAADERLPARHMAYAVSGHPRTGAIDGWMRVVANFPLERPQWFGGERPPATAPPPRATTSGVLPVEKYAGLSRYLDARYPYRLEPGRLVTDPRFGDQRKTVFIELMGATFDHMGFFDIPRETVMVAECVTDALPRYRELGFREITVEEIRASDPSLRDFTMPPGHHLLVYPFLEAHERFHGAVERAVTPEAHPHYDPREIRARIERIDRVLAGQPAQFAKRGTRAHYLKAQSHLALGEWREAEASVAMLERRSVEEPSIQRLRLELEVRRRFDGRTGSGDAAEALKYLRGEGRRRFGDLPAENTSELKLVEYFEALVLVESGQLAALRRHFKPIRERLARHLADQDSRVDWEDRFGPGARPPPRRREYLEGFAAPRVSSLREVYDPARRQGDPARGLLAVDFLMLTAPWGTSAEVRRYRADVLDRLGRRTEAMAERNRAAALSD